MGVGAICFSEEIGVISIILRFDFINSKMAQNYLSGPYKSDRNSQVCRLLVEKGRLKVSLNISTVQDLQQHLQN